MRPIILTVIFLAASQLAFSQIGIGPSVNFTDVIEPLNLSLQTNPQKNYGINLKLGLRNPSYTNSELFESNLIVKRRFFMTESSNLYFGVGGILQYQYYNSRNYFDWGFNVPIGIELFPNPQNQKFSITVESGLYYKAFKQRGIMLRDNNQFGGYGGITLHYYLGKRKK